MNHKKLVNEATQQVLQSDRIQHLVERMISEEVTRMLEDTTLVSLVAKCPKQSKIEAAISYLGKKGITARAIEGAKFNEYSTTEAPEWGIMVEPADVKKAAQILKPVATGLTFDPYIQGG